MNESKDVTVTPAAGLASRPSTAQSNTPQGVQLEGWRHTLVLTSVFTGLFLSFLDTTIVSVALATIAGEFNDFSRATWVITAYLLTYMAFAIIITRLSDIFGRKTVEIMNFVLFIAFSLGCALSRSITELIIFRAFQGIGGSGLFSMTMVIALNSVPPRKRGALSAIFGLVLVTSGVLGPVLSGAITGNHHSSTWRWIFWLNVPVGGVALAVFVLAWPLDRSPTSFTRKSFASIDFLGCLLLLAASILLVFALQEGGAYIYAWSSSTIIACLAVSGLAFVGFVGWQEFLASHPDLPVKLIFPIKVARQRVLGSAMLVALLSGFVYFIAVVQLPQRFQIVDADSPVIAGVKLLPLMMSSAVGSVISGSINSRRNFTPHVLIVASSFQVLGYGLMITLGDAHPTPHRQFGFQVFLGLGFGLAVSTVTMMGQLYAEAQWIAVTQGALTQMRSLGGSIGLAVCVIVFNKKIHASKALADVLDSDQMSALFKSPLVISTFTPQQQALVGRVYAKAFTQEMQVASYIAAVCFMASLLTWQRDRPQPVPPETASAEDTTVECDPNTISLASRYDDRGDGTQHGASDAINPSASTTISMERAGLPMTEQGQGGRIDKDHS